MRITNLQVYDMNNAIRASGYPMKAYLDFDAQHRYIDDLDWKRAMSLASHASSEGHDNFLSGIIVSFDLTCTVKMWTEFERYHFAQIVSSQSTMHRLAKMKLDTAFTPYTDPEIVNRLQVLQKRYNEDPSKVNFLTLLYSCPTGLHLTARVTTNYRQLKTILKQRHNHRLPEWRDFCREIVSQCPLSREFIAKGVTEFETSNPKVQKDV